MFKEIELLDYAGNEKKVPMKATAATPYRFRQIFHEEIPISGDRNAVTTATLLEAGIKSLDSEEAIIKANECIEKAKEKIRKLAYVMAMSAAGEKMDQLNFDKYLEWIECIDSSAFSEEKEDEIWEIYQKSNNNMSTAKK